jgi:hypothetical protein
MREKIQIPTGMQMDSPPPPKKKKKKKKKKTAIRTLLCYERNCLLANMVFGNVQILLNPLYLPGSRITSSHFDTKVRALARKYL